MPTSRLPSWARSLDSYEAQSGEDLANLRGSAGTITPEEAYGFESTGGGKPGRIKGTTRQNDLASMRAFRSRTALPGSPMLSSAGIDARIRGKQDAAQVARYKLWDSVMRQQRGMGPAGAPAGPAKGPAKPMVSVGGGGGTPAGLNLFDPAAASHIPQTAQSSMGRNAAMGPEHGFNMSNDVTKPNWTTSLTPPPLPGAAHISPASWMTPPSATPVDPAQMAGAMTKSSNAQYAGVATPLAAPQTDTSRLKAAMNMGSNAKYR